MFALSGSRFRVPTTIDPSCVDINYYFQIQEGARKGRSVCCTLAVGLASTDSIERGVASSQIGRTDGYWDLHIAGCCSPTIQIEYNQVGI